MAKFSVIIPLYNKAETIISTVESVLQQSYADFEILIIDDGSTDNSIPLIQELDDNRIKIFRQANQGVSVARNNGIIKASGDFICFLDADDLWSSDYLFQQNKLIAMYPDCQVFSCNYIETKCNISPKTLRQLVPSDMSSTYEIENYFQRASHGKNPLWTSVIIVRREAIQKIGGFPEGIMGGEDLLTWAKLAIYFRIAYNDVPLAYYYKKHNNVRRIIKKDIIGKEFERLYHNNSHISYLKEYVAYWFKIRMSVSLLNKEWKEAIKAYKKSLSYDYRQKGIHFTFIKLFIKGFLIKKVDI